ncbi:MAG: phytanoyl-CoA dioxygenase family protein [Candidatus Latescibacterota bacterium]|nr:phytanoyl-CoA dioxygenase family protein [Candidatus Latescibacterota bacterium]
MTAPTVNVDLQYDPIDADMLRQFDEEGYLIIRNALDAKQIATLIEAGDQLIATDLGKGRQRATDGQRDGFRNCVALDPAFVPLIDHPTMLPLVVQLLGANLQLMTSHLIHSKPDPPGTNPIRRQPGWHRDYAQAMMDMGHAAIPRIELKCAYYLTDLTEPSSGVTMVVPGSNRLKVPLYVPEGGDPKGTLEPSLQPGDCLIFENRTWHAGAVNLTDVTRKAVMIGYGYRWVMPMDFRRQASEFVDRLSPLQKYLVGESLNTDSAFHPQGGYNPLREWCEAHGLPTARHPS